MKIAKTAIIYPGVRLGENSVVEDFCILGAPAGSGNAETIIGKNAHLRSFTVIYAGNQIGDNFQTGNKANIREHNRIGNNVSIGTLSVIEHHVEIEDDVRIHSQAFVPEFTVLKKGAWIGPHAVLTNAKYPQEAETKNNLKAPVVEAGARVGANATLLPATNIGERSLVGAGATVVSNVPAERRVAGNPARELGEK